MARDPILQLKPLTEDPWKRPPGHATELAATLRQINALLPLHVDSVRWNDQTLALRLADGSVVEITAGAIVTTLKLAKNTAPGLTNAASAMQVSFDGQEFTWHRAEVAGQIIGNRLSQIDVVASMIFAHFTDGLDLLVVPCAVPSENRNLLLWTCDPSPGCAPRGLVIA